MAETISTTCLDVLIDFNEIIERINTTKDYSREHALRSLHIFTNKREYKKQLLENEQTLQTLIQLLSSNQSQIVQELSISSLANLATVVEYKSLFLEVGLLQPLKHLLQVGSRQCKIDCARLIDQLAIKGSNRQPLCDSGIIVPLIDLINSNDIDGKVEAIKALGILARSASICRVIYEEGGLTIFARTLSNEKNDEIRMQTARLLGNLTKGTPEIISEIIHSNVIASLIDLLQTGSNEGKEQSARTLELLTSNESAVNLMIQHEIVPALLCHIQSSESKDDCSLLGIRDHCLRTLSGIARYASSGGSKTVQSALKEYEIHQEVILTVQGQQFHIK